MIYHKNIVPIPGFHPFHEGIIIIISLQAFIGNIDIRIFLHKRGEYFLNNHHIFRFIFIPEKSDLCLRLCYIRIGFHLSLTAAAGS